MRFPLPPSVAGSSHPSQGTGSARSLSLPAASSQELPAPCLSLRQKQTAPAPGSVRGPFLSVLEFRRPQGSLSLRTVTRPPKSPHTHTSLSASFLCVQERQPKGYMAWSTAGAALLPTQTGQSGSEGWWVPLTQAPVPREERGCGEHFLTAKGRER